MSDPQDSAWLEDCIKLHHVSTVTLYTSALSNPDSLMLSLTTNYLLSTILKSLVDSGSSDAFIDLEFIETWHLPAYGIPLIQLRLIDGTSNCHLTGPGPATLFPYWWVPETDTVCHSVGPELHNCTRIPLAHPLQSLDWLGIGKHLFPEISAAWILELTPCWDISVCSAPLKTSGPCLRIYETHFPGRTLENTESYPHQCCCILPHQQTRGFQMFSTLDLTPWGHWSVHDHFRKHGQHEQCPWRIPQLCGCLQQIKSQQISWTSTIWLQDQLGQRHFSTFQSHLLLVPGGTYGSV